MEIVGFRKPKRPPQPDADAEVAQKPTAANQPEREKKLTGPPARPTSLTQKPTRPKPRPQLKSEKKKFELKIVSSATIVFLNKNETALNSTIIPDNFIQRCAYRCIHSGSL